MPNRNAVGTAAHLCSWSFGKRLGLSSPFSWWTPRDADLGATGVHSASLPCSTSAPSRNPSGRQAEQPSNHTPPVRKGGPIGGHRDTLGSRRPRLSFSSSRQLTYG